MIPPMNDTCIYKKPVVDESGKILKDDQGFILTTDYETECRITEGSNVKIDRDGQTVDVLYTICLPNTLNPRKQDEIQIGDEVVTVLSTKARRNWSGNHIYYWVVQCGQ